MLELRAILKRELVEIFTNPMIYIFTALFSLITGWLFYSLVLASQAHTELTMTNSVLRPMLGNINVIMMLLTPLLTMRSFAGEFQQGTFNLYVMNNIPLFTVWVAKFIALAIAVTFVILPTTVLPLVLSLSGYSDWGVVFMGYLGTWLGLLGYIAVGLFASTLTSNIIVAAIITFSILFGGALLVLSGELATNYLIGKMVSYLSFPSHFQSFSRGVFISYDFFYYISLLVMFCYLSLRSLRLRSI